MLLKSVLIFPPNLYYFTCYCFEKIKISIIDTVLKYSNLLPTNWLKAREVKGFGSRGPLSIVMSFWYDRFGEDYCPTFRSLVC